jgi:hypothetical protein
MGWRHHGQLECVCAAAHTGAAEVSRLRVLQQPSRDAGLDEQQSGSGGAPAAAGTSAHTPPHVHQELAQLRM